MSGIPTASLELDPSLEGGDPVNPAAAQVLPEAVCRHFRMLPVSFDGATLVMAMADPTDAMAQKVAYALTSDPLEVVLAPSAQIDAAIDRIFAGLGDGAATRRSGGTPASVDGALATAPDGIGAMLVERGLIDADDLVEALGIQERTGSRIGEILLSSSKVREPDLAAALADQLRIPLLDPDGLEPPPEALEAIPEALQREGRCVPLAVDDEVLYVAIADPLDDATYEAIRQLTDLRIRTYMVARSALDALLRRVHLDDHVRAARTELLTRFPEDCANRVVTGRQRAALIALLLILVAGLIVAPLATALALLGLFAAIHLLATAYRLALASGSLARRRSLEFTPGEVAALDDRAVPRYTVLVPLFGEAAVVPRLIESLIELEYPPSKLEVLLLCEEDDRSTIDAIAEADPPPYFRLVAVPNSQPKTKPKACNYGLQQASGKFVVVFDAEDRPEPNQLKKALLAWERSPQSVVCVQCKLNYFNAGQNLLTRFFAMEYALWFDLLLPGLSAAGAPIPLGGTSNHFHREALVELGAWDPFNVTEDADLGVRLHRAGQRTVILDSTTLEEANSQPRNWLRQRSRWIKGYLQTYLVHMRHPLQLMREVGPRGWWSFQLIVGGTILTVLNPVVWVLAALWGLSVLGLLEGPQPDLLLPAAGLLLLAGFLACICLFAAGAVKRGLFRLVPLAPLSPIYWGLMSIGAWIGFLQLFTRPFYWAKTEHGLDRRGAR